jgi:hypothetical protein
MEKQHSLGVTQLAILYNHQEFNYMILNSPGFIKFPLPNNTGHPVIWEILLKVVLSTNHQPIHYPIITCISISHSGKFT